MKDIIEYERCLCNISLVYIERGKSEYNRGQSCIGNYYDLYKALPFAKRSKNVSKFILELNEKAIAKGMSLSNEEIINKTIEYYKIYYESKYNISNCYYEIGDYNKSVKMLNEVITLIDSNVYLYI